MKITKRLLIIVIFIGLIMGLMTLKVEADEDVKVSEDGIWGYKEVNDEIMITDCFEYDAEVLEIPETIDEKLVTGIKIDSSKKYNAKKVIVPKYVQPIMGLVPSPTLFIGISEVSFSAFENLESIEVSEENNYYKSEDGVLYIREDRKIDGNLKKSVENIGKEDGIHENDSILSAQTLSGIAEYFSEDIGQCIVYYPISKKDETFELKYESREGILYDSKDELFYKNRFLKKLVISAESASISPVNNIEEITLKNCECDVRAYQENDGSYNATKKIITSDTTSTIVCHTDGIRGYLIFKNWISMIYAPEDSELQKVAIKSEIPYTIYPDNKKNTNPGESTNTTNYTTLPTKTINNQEYVAGIKLENNTVKELINTNNFKEGTTVKVYKYGQEITGDEKVGTGTIIKVLENGEVKEEYVAVIYGDTDGDGDMTSIDALSIIKNKTGEIPFTTDAQKEAAKVTDKDGTEPGAVDALAITMTRLGKAILNQETGLVTVN